MHMWSVIKNERTLINKKAVLISPFKAEVEAKTKTKNQTQILMKTMKRLSVGIT
jgi:hypothetical protein